MTNSQDPAEQPVADVGSTPTSPVTTGVTVTSELVGELRAF